MTLRLLPLGIALTELHCAIGECMEQTKDGHVLDLLGEMERQALAVDDALDRIETYIDEQDDTSVFKEFRPYYDAQGREHEEF